MGAQNMTLTGIGRRFHLPLSEHTFLALGIAFILLTRIIVIFSNPHWGTNWDDLLIYQHGGREVLAHVNPYDPSDNPSMRQSLIVNLRHEVGKNYLTETPGLLDAYAADNPPMAMILYTALEWVTQGARLMWRLLLILGDIAIFLGLFALFKAVRGTVSDLETQVGIFCLAVFNPVLIVWGTLMAEDKQVQTALLLFGAALLLAPKPATVARNLGTGIALSVAILFKIFGVFLFPLWLARAKQYWPKFALWTIVGGLIPLALCFVLFGYHFVQALLTRMNRDSAGVGHGSPWALTHLPVSQFFILKLAIVIVFCGIASALLIKRRIDLLNFCAMLNVAFACVWLQTGSMDRMNIAILFAIASLITLSTRLFLAFSASAMFVSGVCYLIEIGRYKLDFHLEQLDGVLTLLFVCAYISVLVVHANIAPTSNSKPVEVRLG